MSYKFEHEKSDKSLKVDGFDKGIDDIKFEKSTNNDKKPNKEFFEEPQELEEDDMGVEFITNENKRLPEEEDNYEAEEEDEEEYEQSQEDPMMTGRYAESDNESEASAPRLSYEETQQQKAYYLSQLKRLTDKGNVPSRRFGYEHSLNEIKQEVLRIRKEIEINRGVNYCKQGLMFCVSTIEMLNTKYDPFSIDLDGWSNVIMADKESYNDVFEELYEKYSSKITTSPEIKLIMMVAGSAMMFHLQKTIINKQFSSGGDSGGMLGSLINKLSGGGETSKPKSSENKEQKMKGPSVDTDELLKKLNSDDFSDVSSVTSEVKEKKKEDDKEGKTISVTQPKKRGRKPKNSK